MKQTTVSCIVLRLASLLAPDLTGDPQSGNEFINELNQIALPQARVVNTYENNNGPVTSNWVDYETPPVFDTTQTVTGSGNAWGGSQV